MDALRKEITMVKTFFADLEKANLEKGDKFTAANNISYKNINGLVYGGSDFMPFVRRGILKIVRKEFVQLGSRYTAPKVVTPEEIIAGEVKGLFYARNVYKVVIDNFEEYLTTVLAETLQ